MAFVIRDAPFTASYSRLNSTRPGEQRFACGWSVVTQEGYDGQIGEARGARHVCRGLAVAVKHRDVADRQILALLKRF